MKRKQFVVFVRGENHLIEVHWSPAWGQGSVWIDGLKEASWGAPLIAFKRHDFYALEFPMAIVRSDGRRAPHAIGDVSVEINGVPISSLVSPAGLGSPVHTQTVDKVCPQCHGDALWLVADDNAVTVVCASCGRFFL